MAKIIGLPDGTEGEFPDTMSDEEIASILRKQFPPTQAEQAPPQPLSGKRPAPVEELGMVDKALASLPNWLLTGNKQMRGVAQGAADPSIGAAQLVGNVAQGIDKFNPMTVIKNKLLGGEPSQAGDNINRWVREKEAEYQKQRGDTGFDTARLAGNVISPMNVIPASKLKYVPELAGRILQGIGLSGVAGLSEPVTSDDPYFQTKGEQTRNAMLMGAALPVAGKAASSLAGVGADVLGGVGTRTGGESIKQAFKAGLEGGERQASFLDNLRGNADMGDVVEEARKGIFKMGQRAQDSYKSGMVDIKNDKSVLGFDKIDKALGDARNMVTFKDQIENKSAANVLQEINEKVSSWKNLDKADYHTPAGMDSLKKQVWSVIEAIPIENRTAKKLGMGVYNSIKDEISEQAPTYAKVMRDYEVASRHLSEIEKGLVGGQKSTVDSSLRKLQSLMRNNANTNYGNRLNLAETLEREGGSQIMPGLAGQAMSSWVPRGFGSLMMGGTGLAGAGAVGASGAGALPLVIGALASQSPRAVGEAARGIGVLSRLVPAARELGIRPNALMVQDK